MKKIDKYELKEILIFIYKLIGIAATGYFINNVLFKSIASDISTHFLYVVVRIIGFILAFTVCMVSLYLTRDDLDS